MKQISRRLFVGGCAGLLAASAMGVRLAFAQAPGNNRLLVVLLRGGMDGLAAVVPYTDKRYMDMRGVLAPPDFTRYLRLNDDFAIHGNMAFFAELFADKQLSFLHATTMPYRTRSHFDAQDVLENGGKKPHSLHTGWLNRALVSMQASEGVSERGVALGSAVPLLLRGDAKVASWAPKQLAALDEDFMARVMGMYENDPLILNALHEAMASENEEGAPARRNANAFNATMEKAATFLRKPDGPRVAAAEMIGWDTHSNQGLFDGKLASNFATLSEGLRTFAQTMAEEWANTAVLVMTEFGRTVAANGTGGSDHGTGSVAFLLGGNVAGGKMLGDWPGLARLQDDRDLLAPNDLRSLMKGVLMGHMGIDEGALGDIFPESYSAEAYTELFNLAPQG